LTASDAKQEVTATRSERSKKFFKN
jgi:hypothetical protein